MSKHLPRLPTKKVLFGALFAAALYAAMTAALAAPTFSDVPETHWAYPQIEKAAADGAIRGYANGTFEPASPLTVAHFTVILSRSFYTEEYNTALSWITPDAKFVEWYSAAQWVAEDHGLFKNMTSDILDPLTRYEMAMEIYNLLMSKGCEFTRDMVRSGMASIQDLDQFPNDTIRNAVACLYSKGILMGYADGRFYGNEIPNRAQASTIYCRLRNFLNELAEAQAARAAQPQTPTPTTSGPNYGTLPNKSPSKMTVRDVFTPGQTTGKTFTFQGSQIPIYAGVETLKVSAGEFAWRSGNRIVYTGNRYDARFGVDVSAYQNNDRASRTLDWAAAKADGVQFAMVRVGLRGTSTGALREDAYYARNIEGALAQGIQTGAYIFAQAVNIQEAIEEADFVIARLRGHKINGPVSYDWELNSTNYRAYGLSKEMATACAVAFCKRVAAAGYTPMYYNSRHVAYTKYDQGALEPYMMWYPQYPTTSNKNPYPNLYYQMDYWQFTESGKVNGIGNKIDCNIWFRPKN
ncbi:MAG: S-layer homology domain-containing protein [Oscillospiraceae bacterium]|nr:S-layer homology domain-containing protein [Oscillospiraceae bacterium]